MSSAARPPALRSEGARSRLILCSAKTACSACSTYVMFMSFSSKLLTQPSQSTSREAEPGRHSIKLHIARAAITEATQHKNREEKKDAMRTRSEDAMRVCGVRVFVFLC